jgi:hypothetical protein
LLGVTKQGESAPTSSRDDVHNIYFNSNPKSGPPSNASILVSKRSQDGWSSWTDEEVGGQCRYSGARTYRLSAQRDYPLVEPPTSLRVDDPVHWALRTVITKVHNM